MITVGHYDSVNTDIIADHFPVKGEGKKETEVVLFHFGKTTTSGQVISEMEKAGCRPAQIEELLALGASQPDLQKQFPIVALGSVWRDSDGHRDVPYLHWGGVGRDLLLRWFGRGWTEDYRFLAVRK